jgi:hypothetical protein
MSSGTNESLGPHHPLLDPRFLDTSLVKDGHLDKSRLQQELSASFVVEHKRKAEDDMKKRAIMTAKNYDEFAALVSVATLKPLKTKEIDMRCTVNANKALVAGSGMDLTSAAVDGLNSVSNDVIGFGLLPSASNALPSTKHTSSSIASSSSSGTNTLNSIKTGKRAIPANASDFEREWRKISSTSSSSGDKFAFLEAIGAQQIGQCFRTGIDADILSSILSTISKTISSSSDDSAEKVCLVGCEILFALSNTPSFSLNKSMMGAQATRKKELDEILLKTRSTSNEEIGMNVYSAFVT